MKNHQKVIQKRGILLLFHQKHEHEQSVIDAKDLVAKSELLTVIKEIHCILCHDFKEEILNAELNSRFH